MIVHLAKRFFFVLRGARVSQVDDEWAISSLNEPEVELWNKLPANEKLHGVIGARHVERCLPEFFDPNDPIEAALLHDVGKLDSQLGIVNRVIATLLQHALGERLREMRRGWLRKYSLYVCHDDSGADRLILCGASELAVWWAREHHMSPEDWNPPEGVSPAVGETLRIADSLTSPRLVD